MAARKTRRLSRHLDRACRLARAGCIALAAVAPAAWPRADARQAAAPAQVAPSEGPSVFVSGVPDTFQKLRESIAKAKQETGRDYRVIVVGNAGEDEDAAKRALDAIVDRWRETADRGDATPFDPTSDVTILLDVGGRALAYRAPWSLEVSSGLDRETAERELVKKIFLPRAREGRYDEGLADLVAATEAWVKDRRDREVARAEAARIFRTRTLPIGAAALAGFGGLAAFFLQRWRHDRRMHEARTKLDSFKGEVVALSDLLDGQQERHRMLPHSDPDFQTPMRGLTRVAYDDVQQSVRRYRERWLSLMDVWEKAQQHVDSEWYLGTASAEKAIALLDSADARPPLDEVAAACRVPLDTLETAHEKARELAASLEGSIAATNERLSSFAARGRSSAIFQEPLATVERGLATAREELEADPVAARGRLEESETALATTIGRIERMEAVDDRLKRANEETQRVTRKVAARRAEGWLLAEPGADPDVRLAEAVADATTAAGLLDAGEIDSAERHVERAEQAAAEADATLESVIAAKARVEELLPGCEARLGAIAGRQGPVERALEHLAGSYAEASWSDVADNPDRAEQGLARARELLAAARAAAAPDRQHYFHAVALAEEAVRQEEWSDACLAAVEDRRRELDGLRDSLPGRTEGVARKAADLLSSLARQRTDRVRANEHAREAEHLVRTAAERFTRQRPDLREVSAMVDAGDQAVTRATELAAEDERLARQAIHEIEETENLVRRVASWYEEGVSADVRGATGGLEQAKALLERQRYEESIKASSEASQAARHSYAAATAEATRRRQRRLAEIQRRQMEDSFARMSRGAGPWVIQLPGGHFTGPDPWRSMRSAAGTAARQGSRSAGGSWANDTVQVRW